LSCTTEKNGKQKKETWLRESERGQDEDEERANYLPIFVEIWYFVTV
jgi:hypothetical protein